MIAGYIAERKLRELFENDERVMGLRKDDDHDRTRKGDLVCTYKAIEFKIEVKSLQTNTICCVTSSGRRIPAVVKVREPAPALPKAAKPGATKWRYVRNLEFDSLSTEERVGGAYEGRLQCDASDRRIVRLRDGAEIATTCLRVGEFDVLAACLFGFRERWDFGFALNRDLPRSSFRNYDAGIREQLLASLVPATWPLREPFVADPFILLDRLVRERQRTRP